MLSSSQNKSKQILINVQSEELINLFHNGGR